MPDKKEFSFGAGEQAKPASPLGAALNFMAGQKPASGSLEFGPGQRSEPGSTRIGSGQRPESDPINIEPGKLPKKKFKLPWQLIALAATGLAAALAVLTLRAYELGRPYAHNTAPNPKEIHMFDEVEITPAQGTEGDYCAPGSIEPTLKMNIPQHMTGKVVYPDKLNKEATIILNSGMEVTVRLLDIKKTQAAPVPRGTPIIGACSRWSAHPRV